MIDVPVCELISLNERLDTHLGMPIHFELIKLPADKLGFYVGNFIKENGSCDEGSLATARMQVQPWCSCATLGFKRKYIFHFR
jgi:hypothetical protein